MTIEIPPPPADPPTVHLDEQQVSAVDTPADTEVDTPALAADERSAHRIQDWWTGRHVDLTKPTAADEDEAAEECDHPEPLELYDAYGDLVAYLCPACDAQLPADTPEETETEAYGGLVERTRSAASKTGRWLPAGAAGIQLNPRARRLVYNGSAAALGWYLHLGPPISALIKTCGREAGIGAALVLGLGICGAAAWLVDRRTRHWWPPLAWVCRAPLATAVLALCLYAPASI
ncbi:hypothetical protein [Streptomyces sp. HJ7]